MVCEDVLKRKAQIVNRILHSVDEYHRVKGEGIPWKILSARYGKAGNGVGGFPEIMEELQVEGVIEVAMRDTGARTVYPKGECVKLDRTQTLLIPND